MNMQRKTGAKKKREREGGKKGEIYCTFQHANKQTNKRENNKYTTNKANKQIHEE